VKVKEIGFGFYYFFPVLYVNLNESWKLKKEKRTIINLSGIYIQLIAGFFLAIFIYFFEDNRILTSIFKINFYLVLLNLNPFLKFDGYWVLSDFLEGNNLLKTSNRLIKEKFKHESSSKFKNWITLYTILRILFIIYIIFSIIKRTTVIITKYVEQIKFSNDENIFIIIMSLYIFRIIFTILKKHLK
jgi:putative peptide zinc metalloprotease protein